MEIKTITDERDFKVLERAWRDLEAAGAVKDITVTWEWMSTWWDVFKDGRGLAVLLMSEGDEAIGIAPFISRTVRYFGMIPFKRLEFIASGEDEVDEICSDYLDFVIKPGREREVLDSLLTYLAVSKDLGWDELLLPRMLDDSPNLQLLRELAAKHSLNLEEVNIAPCTYADLSPSLEEYVSNLGRRTRKQIRRDMNRLDDSGEVEFKIAVTEEEIQQAKEILVELHQKRWTQDGKPGVYASEKFQKFHDIMMKIAHDKEWLRLGTLIVNNEPLASGYNFRFGNKIYAYQCGVKIDEDTNISVGTIADVYAIREAISEGLKEYDFLAGATYYKKRLATNERNIVTLRISKRSPRDAIYSAVQKLRRIKNKKPTREPGKDENSS